VPAVFLRACGPGGPMTGHCVAVVSRSASRRAGRGHITLHLPAGWHHEHDWLNLLTAACGPPVAAA